MRFSQHFFLGFALASGALFITTSARAEGQKVGVSFGLYSGDSGDAGNATVIAPLIDGTFNISERLQLRLALPLTNISQGDDGTNRFQFGNPYMAGYWRGSGGPLKFRLGVGVALPGAQVPDDADRVLAEESYFAAAAMRGLKDQWLWTPGRLSLVVPLDAELNLGLMTFRADAAWAYMISVEREDTSETLAQFGGEALVHLGPVGLGVRGQTVWMPALGGQTQTSVAPLAELDIGPFSARTMWVFNLNAPQTFSYDRTSDHTFWGWHMSAAVRF